MFPVCTIDQIDPIDPLDPIDPVDTVDPIDQIDAGESLGRIQGNRSAWGDLPGVGGV